MTKIERLPNACVEYVSHKSAAYSHEAPDQIVGVGVILFGGQLRGVQLSSPEDLQHSIQSLGHCHRAALLRCVYDIYHLRKRGKKSP